MAAQASALAPAAALVTVMDQHGKVVHNTSKAFFSAFREGYKARKAEIAAERQAQRRARDAVTRRRSHDQSQSRRVIEELQEGGDTTTAVAKREKRKPRKHSAGDDGSERGGRGGSDVGGARALCDEDLIAEDALVREDALARRSGGDNTLYASAAPDVLGMAPALFHDPSVLAVQELLARVQSMIDEISCWTAGISTLISEMQKTPEILAQVGLSLAEISQTITHVAPAATIFLKSAFPTVFALLSSPQFAVVAGVAGAATVVVLGGYRIVKKFIAGADENLKLANEGGNEEHLGGAILGEVIEDRLLENSKTRKEEVVLRPVGRRENSRKAIMPADDTELREERKAVRRKEEKGGEKEDRWKIAKLNKADRKPTLKESELEERDRKKDRKDKEERRREKESKEERRREKEDKDKKDKEGRRREKEDKEERRREKEARRERREKRHGSSSNSSGVSSHRGDSAEDVRTTSRGKDREKEKDAKERKGLKGLFNGRSA